MWVILEPLPTPNALPKVSHSAVRQISLWTAQFHGRLSELVVQAAQAKGQEVIDVETVDRAVCHVLSKLESELKGHLLVSPAKR